MVSAVDDGIGRILEHLESLDIIENTMIFFYLTTVALNLKMGQIMAR